VSLKEVRVIVENYKIKGGYKREKVVWGHLGSNEGEWGGEYEEQMVCEYRRMEHTYDGRELVSSL